MGEKLRLRVLKKLLNNPELERLSDQVFEAHDEDADHHLTQEEVTSVIRDSIMSEEDEELEGLGQDFDADKSGRLDKQEFEKAVTTLFGQFDTDKNGFLDKGEFFKFYKHVIESQVAYLENKINKQ
eukprot:TRINITY_DN14844_c0_g1_i1.p1 TRINITY_DN14844_c0_g1~~TRINITY_DN14844_c0_g1_i1.p1  ORF type:complete len:126 (+),score=34.81 TRINITY_DN14844_c0_g1_i1:22-399(+)